MSGVILDPITGRPASDLELLLPAHIAESLRLSRLLGDHGPQMMADSKISALTALTTLADTDEMVVATGGASKKITGSNLRKSIFATTVDATLSGDVTMINANTFYDGPSASMVAGTWMIWWKTVVQVIVSTSQSYWWTTKLWDGTTVYDEAEDTTGATAANQSGFSYELSGFALVTLSGTVTMKISTAPGRGSSSSKMMRDPVDNSGASHTATRLTGLKIG